VKNTEVLATILIVGKTCSEENAFPGQTWGTNFRGKTYQFLTLPNLIISTVEYPAHLTDEAVFFDQKFPNMKSMTVTCLQITFTIVN